MARIGCRGHGMEEEGYIDPKDAQVWKLLCLPMIIYLSRLAIADIKCRKEKKRAGRGRLTARWRLPQHPLDTRPAQKSRLSDTKPPHSPFPFHFPSSKNPHTLPTVPHTSTPGTTALVNRSRAQTGARSITPQEAERGKAVRSG